MVVIYDVLFYFMFYIQPITSRSKTNQYRVIESVSTRNAVSLSGLYGLNVLTPLSYVKNKIYPLTNSQSYPSWLHVVTVMVIF